MAIVRNEIRDADAGVIEGAAPALDILVKAELGDKNSAIRRYDDMLWRIRSGYAVMLYGSIGIIAGLVNQKEQALDSAVGWAAVILIAGFSVVGGALDYQFMEAKLRVVKYRDRLVELAWKRANHAALTDVENVDLKECLKNSGERSERGDWARYVGPMVPLVYYGGTGLVCSAATRMLTFAT